MAKKKKIQARPLLVECPMCGLRQYECTGRYDPDKPAHPGMIRMRDPWDKWGWEHPPKDDSAGFGCLECGECGAPLAPNGRLVVV